MHFEILVEGEADRLALRRVLPKILGPDGDAHTYKIHKHRGIGKLPSGPRAAPHRNDRTLLHNLPSKLRAYGGALGPDDAVVVVVDLDTRDCLGFKRELVGLLDNCDPAPRALFRIAIEELESWFLGDPDALRAAYPHANLTLMMNSYQQDSICGTWEVLADAVYAGGAKALRARGRRAPPGQEKCSWAKMIAPHMDINRNKSPSFRAFRDGLLKLAGGG